MCCSKIFNRKQGLLLGFLTVLLSNQVWAQKAATVMPKGYFRYRFVNIQAQSVRAALDNNGQAESLMEPLNQNVSASQLTPLKPLYDALEAYQQGLGDSLISAQLSAGADIRMRQMVQALEYGVTSKVSIGAILPYYMMRARGGFGADVSTNSADVRTRVSGMAPLETGLDQFDNTPITTATFASSIFTSNGYSVPGETIASGLGDLELGAKYQYFKNDLFRSTFLGGVRLPTATHKKDYSNLLDQEFGNRQYDLAAELVGEFTPGRNWILSAASRYTLQLPDTRNQPLLRDGQTGLPNLNDNGVYQDVRFDLGDILESEAGVTFVIPPTESWSLAAVYSHTLKFSDRYSAAPGFQTANLEADTNSVAHRVELVFGYSSIPEFRRKKATIPFEIKGSYNQIFAGRNTTISDYSRLDFILYF